MEKKFQRAKRVNYLQNFKGLVRHYLKYIVNQSIRENREFSFN